VCAETEGSIIVMPKNARTGHTAYICECGKKWSIPKKELSADAA
jgi:hypothetical protein